MKPTNFECHVLVVPDYKSAAGSSAQDDIVVIVSTDEGIAGIGEVDINPWVAKAMIEAKGTHNIGQGLSEMLLRQDHFQPEALWERMYMGSLMTGRRGLGICAMGALDMALWDIRGKALGQPCWQLLGGAKKEFITPYASLLPVGWLGYAWKSWQRTLWLLAERRINCEKLITHELPPHWFLEAIGSSRDGSAIRIVLKID